MKHLSHKQITIISIISLMIIAPISYIGYKKYQNKKFYNENKPLITFKENIIIEYGTKDIKPEAYIIKEKSRYEKLEQLKDNKLDTLKIGKGEYKINAINKGIKKDFSLKYEIKDTKKPIITARDLETIKGTKLDLSKYISAKDEIDGALKVEFTDNTDYNKPDTYEVIAKAKDKNNLSSEAKFKVVVKDMPKQTAKTNTANTANDGYYEDDYNYSQDTTNNNVSNNKEEESDTELWAEYEQYKQRLIAEGIASGSRIYKDYGDFFACSPHAEEVASEYPGFATTCDQFGILWVDPDENGNPAW